MMDHQELTQLFTPTVGDDLRTKRHEAIRTAGLNFALLLNGTVPDDRELKIAIGCVEEAVMWANKGIAIRARRYGS
jgi:hypothetical protein